MVSLFLFSLASQGRLPRCRCAVGCAQAATLMLTSLPLLGLHRGDRSFAPRQVRMARALDGREDSTRREDMASSSSHPKRNSATAATKLAATVGRHRARDRQECPATHALAACISAIACGKRRQRPGPQVPMGGFEESAVKCGATESSGPTPGLIHRITWRGPTGSRTFLYAQDTTIALVRPRRALREQGYLEPPTRRLRWSFTSERMQSPCAGDPQASFGLKYMRMSCNHSKLRAEFTLSLIKVRDTSRWCTTSVILRPVKLHGTSGGWAAADRSWGHGAEVRKSTARSCKARSALHKRGNGPDTPVSSRSEEH